MRARAKTGWIGLDVGSRAVKVAQLRRHRDRIVLGASAVARGDGLEEARALAAGLRGAVAAATLSMEHCRVEPTDPDAPADPARCAARWVAGLGSDYTLSTDQSRVATLLDRAAGVGWQCDVIDGAPLALARALRFAEGYTPSPLLGALDWGEQAVTLVAASDGAARYARRLGGGGFDSIAASVGESLGLTPEGAAKLLRQRGAAPPPHASPDQRVVYEAVRAALRPLAQEVQRTLEHLGAKLRSAAPDRVLVFGAGAAAPGLANALGALAGVLCEPWRAPWLEREGELAEVPDCLLGQAIALSALAWEPHP